MTTPCFITFDGIDGTGKSTQLPRFVAWLESMGRTVVTCRDPGSTLLGNRLREILLSDRQIVVHPRAEMLLYMAARAQLVAEVIAPALAAGSDVVCDRFLLANVAYQAYGGGLAVDDVWTVGHVATGGLTPHVTFLLDMPASASAARIGREHDKLESRGVDYLEQVRQGFLTEARRRTEIAVIDAAGTPDDVQARIVQAARERLALSFPA
jgi:dTMP kinase